MISEKTKEKNRDAKGEGGDPIDWICKISFSARISNRAVGSLEVRRDGRRT
jgi:hypothetical protein